MLPGQRKIARSQHEHARSGPFSDTRRRAMNAIHEFLLVNPLLQTGLDIISVTIPLAALLAFAGMGFM